MSETSPKQSIEDSYGQDQLASANRNTQGLFEQIDTYERL
jgi:hypothetical protein